MIISKDSGKAVDKIWCPFMIETLSKLRIECNFLHLIKKKKILASGQDGGVGRYPSLSHKTKDTTNFKTNINQKCQKIELYRSPTAKELKKKHSSRLVGGAEMGIQGGEDSWKGSSWWSSSLAISCR